MIIFKKGNIFDSEYKTLVNTVNCEGVMGKGLALQFKEKYKGTLMFSCYQHACKYWNIKSDNTIKYNTILNEGGDIYFWYFTKANIDNNWLPFENLFDKIHGLNSNNEPSHHVLYFATKEYWRNSSKIEWIERGLYNFAEKDYEIDDENFKFWNMGPDTWINGMKTIAWPKLGCTNGGLKWEDVKPLMIKYLEPLPILCEIYE
jgi:O-acetyl-ADP-ribose deacetylase (regulator of RNase III)